MFIINYSNFIESAFYGDFSVSYMPGLKVAQMKSALVALNVDSKTAYIYCE